MDIALIVLAVCASNVACFFIGARVGQAVQRGEKVEAPTLNPVKAVQEHRERQEAKLEEEFEKNRVETILRNIDNYDGTGRGQAEIPGR